MTDTKKKIRVGLLFGGESIEHEVSLMSAKVLIDLFDKKKYTVLPIGITRKGEWRLPKKPKQSFTDILRKGERFFEWGKLPKKVDVIFPCLHGAFGEDGTIQGLCELLNLPYAGCGVLSSALGIDKSIQKRLFNQQKLPVLESYSFERWTWKVLSKEILSDIRQRFAPPVFIKPCRLGSSFGISLLESMDDLEKTIIKTFKYDTKIIVEKGIRPTREFSVAVIGNRFPEVSVVGEIIHTSKFDDFDSKYIKASLNKYPAEIPEEVSKQMRLWASMAYMALECKGFARVDFLANQDLSQICVGELNTLPGMTATSLFFNLWRASGKQPVVILDQLIDMALTLHKEKIR